ncbi:MAG TPA: diadenylate cyclase CdaA [Thermoclostridium sp.]|nr:diadenylate cyclase CdaA [Thermoclostridium sp.]
MADINSIKDFLILIGNFLGLDGLWDTILMLVDISIISYIVYKIIQLVRETRAMQLVKGILVIVIGLKAAQLMGLRTLAFILEGAISLLGFSLIVLFQPELRRGLEKIGNSGFQNLFSIDDNEEQLRTTSTIEAIVNVCKHFSEEYIGALIVIERNTKIGDIINTGTQMDSLISYEILANIFMPNTPLHDGAVIIRDNKIKAAACYLPLTENSKISRELGTRHRAALGITEVSDAISIVVSEESGKISYAHNGGLMRNLTPDTLRKALYRFLLDKNSNKKRFWFRKVKADE